MSLWITERGKNRTMKDDEEEEKIGGGEGLMRTYMCVSHHQQGEHGLSHVESVSPVVVGDPPVAFTERVYELHQGLHNTGFFCF